MSRLNLYNQLEISNIIKIRRHSYGVRVENKRTKVKEKKSLQEVANAIKISKTHIWEIERGTAKNPSLNLLESLSSYFGETIDSLINDDNKIDKNKSFARKIKGMNLSDADYEKLEFAAEMLKSRQSD